MNKSYYVYILASKKNGVLYIGVTSDLQNRINQHKNEAITGFTSRYFVHKLVYYEQTEDVNSAISREKILKKWNRNWKIRLIEKNNPTWGDLSEDWYSSIVQDPRFRGDDNINKGSSLYFFVTILNLENIQRIRVMIITRPTNTRRIIPQGMTQNTTSAVSVAVEVEM